MTLFSPINIRHSNCEGINRPISLKKWFNNLRVKPFSLKQHQMHFSIPLMPSSYSTVFWLWLYSVQWEPLHWKRKMPFMTLNITINLRHSNCTV